MGFISYIAILVSLVVTGLGIVLLGGSLMDFLDLPSALLVIVPTICSVITSFPLSVLAKIPGHLKIMVKSEARADIFINMMVDMAKKSRTDGLLSLEKEETGDPFMQYALRMVVDGIDESMIKASLEDSLESLNERHAEAISIYEKAGNYSPAFGMCATIVGLVNMLMGLDFTDPNAITSLGVNMAAALITTLYGSMFANIIFLPIAARLKVLHKKEVFCKTMMANGILAIQRGDSPGILYDSLVEQMDHKTKMRLEKGGSEGEKK